ncbi:hypothetical protein H2200_004225 [Cladophialophora chaetospira]|uniref:Heterokaryon incompatibility domain-containing protein n=1 Tax=Cladophialophora chaetospira TaxID=386627 RepID=A0AA38XFP9_9EURO|nr:hypothetical protein H2200_004225 [Cladophialophora chaetospira]
MFSAAGGFGAIGGFAAFGQTLSSVVEDATTIFQDAFDAFEETPKRLRPNPPTLEDSTIDLPIAASPYQWAKLKSDGKRRIRLVKIRGNEARPVKSEALTCKLLQSNLPFPQVKCEIITEDLDKLSGQYDAVSYSWLDMNADIPLAINEGQTLMVNPSLIACLQHLLRKQPELTLWWDNICVKQTENDEDDEIASQVAMMKDIFNRARTTYIWLGESDADSSLALQALEQICQLNGEECTSDEERASRAKALVSEGFKELDSQASLKRTAIAKFLNRKYFERAFIYQEAASSKKLFVLVGDRELDFDRLCDAVHAYCSAEGDKMRRSAISLGNPLQVVAHGYNTLEAIRRGRRELIDKNAVDPKYLQTILCRVAGSVKATRDHDLVYAFLGFQGPNTAAPITIDYKIDVSTAYNNAAWALMRQAQNLELFGICGGKSRTGLASWAPNWTLRLPQGQPICPAGIQSQFNASQGMKFAISASIAKRPEVDEAPPPTLATHGIVVDTVVATSGLKFDYAKRNELGIDNFIQLRRHVEFLNEWFSKNTDARAVDDGRVMRVLLADGAFVYSRHAFDMKVLAQSRLSDSDMLSLLDAYANDAAIRKDKGGGLFGSLMAQKKEAYARLRKQSLICVKKMLFVTQQGHLGLAPEQVQVGDKVCIIGGSQVPLVLRRHMDVAKHPAYSLVGQGYLEGAMDGEMVDSTGHSKSGEILLV